MKIDKYDFRIGADPEFFVQQNGKAVSAYGLVPGSKEKPFPVPKGAVQVDGMALEFNINPAESYAEFEDHMSTVLGAIIDMVPGYEILVEQLADNPFQQVYGSLPKPVAEFGLDYIEAQPKEAKELGCSPDYNAYTKEANPRPDAQTPFRTASGHVHIGWTNGVSVDNEGHLEACRALTKSLDVWLGIPSLIWDGDDKRRQLYGAAGSFRPKPYGMEYRVLSNAWISNPVLRCTVYHNTIQAIKSTFINPDFGDKSFAGMTAKEIIETKDRSSDNWRYVSALTTAFDYEGILTPGHYRNKFF